MLERAGIRCNGYRPWDIRVSDPRFYSRVLAEGTLGLGESYMDGWWECDALDEFCHRAILGGLDRRAHGGMRTLLAAIAARLINQQTKPRARRVGRGHYDLGNDFFQAMLDPAMQYSCACFRDADDLASAQRRKMDLICTKLGLGAGMRLLDVGCGWGGLMRHAATHYGCSAVGITISAEQHRFAMDFRKDLPIEVRLQDYRDTREQFDRIVSVGMLEHVGARNYRAYFRVMERCLAQDGLFLCHTITTNSTSHTPDRWIAKYIFPNSVLPSAAQVLRAAEGLFVLEDAENLGPNYDRTLLAWEKNFRQAWPRFRNKFGERFYRMWRFYLLGCAGAFRARAMQVQQFLFSPRGVPGGWRRPV